MVDLVVVGADGLEPNLAHRWMIDGYLPNLKRVVKDGAYGVAACSSMNSAGQWTNHFTGMTEGTHGVTNFLKQELKDRRLGKKEAPENKELINLSNIEFKTYPELLSEAGFSVGLVNPLPIWPPLKLNDGLCVSGMLTPPSSNDRVNPPELEEKLQEHDYAIDVKYRDRPYGFVDDEVMEEESLETLERDMFSVMENRISFSKDIIENEDLDVLYVLIKSTDIIQHCFWGPMEAEDEEFGNTIRESYETVDNFVGWISKNTDANLLVMSDHGFTERREAPRSVNVIANTVKNLLPHVPTTLKRLYKSSQKASNEDYSDPDRITGVHDAPAFWALTGPDVRPSEKVEVEFEDLTATILSIVGHPIPEQYVGEPIGQVLEADPKYEDFDLSMPRRGIVDEADSITERLHNLGYAEMVE